MSSSTAIDMGALSKLLLSRDESSIKYTLVAASWNDSLRQKNSCLGPKMNDCVIVSKDGKIVYHVRPENFNEKIGTVKMSKVYLRVEGESVPLDEYLITLKETLSKMGHSVTGEIAFEDASVRGAVAFVLADTEIAATTYSYQTSCRRDPSNLHLLCTEEGVWIRFDGVGATPLIPSEDDMQTWMKVSSSSLSVAGEEMLFSGSQTAPRALFGVNPSPEDAPTGQVMVVTISLKQKSDEELRGLSDAPVYRSMSCSSASSEGVCRRANLSKGSNYGALDTPSKLSLRFDEHIPVVISTVHYIAVTPVGPGENVVISAKDVLSAASLIDKFYNRCKSQGDLFKMPAMCADLTAQDEAKIQKTLSQNKKKKLFFTE
jgi:hypothetical protein